MLLWYAFEAQHTPILLWSSENDHDNTVNHALLVHWAQADISTKSIMHVVRHADKASLNSGYKHVH